MNHKRLALRAFFQGTAFAASVLCAGAVCVAQNAGKVSPKPPAGKTILLPRQMIAGEKATLAVLDSQGRLTPGAVVEFSTGGRATTDSTGRAVFIAPPPGVLLAHLAGRPGNVPAVILPGTQSGPAGLRVTSYPRVVSLTDRFEVLGSGFQGEATANRAALSGKEALVVAASPIALTLIPSPDLAWGPAQFTVNSSGRTVGPLPLTLVSLELSADKDRLAADESGTLTVRVRGSSQRLTVEIRNLSPDLVALASGTVQQLTTSGGADNTARVKLRGVRPGDFSISVRLVHSSEPL
jgi:hypothetical protein